MTTNVTDQARRAERLRGLHRDPEILHLLNVWDVASARAVAGRSDTRALATASAAIAAAHGYEDGEHIPIELHLAAIARICSAVDLPVTADLERGYGDAHATTAAAIRVGAVGVNLEDDLVPAEEFGDSIRAAVRAGSEAGVPVVVNARTDVYLYGGAEDDRRCAAAIDRGLAYLDAGADCVFVPGLVAREEVVRLVRALGPQRTSLLALPGLPDPATLEGLGVARLSHGPALHRAAMALVAEYDASAPL